MGIKRTRRRTGRARCIRANKEEEEKKDFSTKEAKRLEISGGGAHFA